MILLAVAAIIFVGSHFLLSHPLRQSLVQGVGEGPFRGIYSLVAVITLGAMIWIYRGLGRQVPLWTPGEILWFIASLLMWVASILFVGSFIRNPAFPGAPGPSGAPRGIFTITRHPMNWSFAIWAIVHAAVVATPKAFILDGAILFLAIAGSALQDRKKAGHMGELWNEWTAHTTFVPFARGAAFPGAVALVGGTIVFFAATWLHPIPAGFWRWIG
jgi:uncharacterized membrane protein